jgi:hypothetical protein
LEGEEGVRGDVVGVVFKILFEEVGFQMFLKDGQGLCCPRFRGKLVAPLGCQDREELGLG